LYRGGGKIVAAASASRRFNGVLNRSRVALDFVRSNHATGTA
jgi:hypothetical protein